MGGLASRESTARRSARLLLGAALGFIFCLSYRGPAIAGAGLVRISDGRESFPVTVGDTLHPAPGWPVWLKDYTTSARGEKTSGIAFAGGDVLRGRCFVLADEVGFLRLCRVHQESDTGGVEVRLGTVTAGESLEEHLADHEVWDFEALSIDPALRQGTIAAHAAGARGDEIRGAGADGGGDDLFAACAGDTLTGLLSIEGRGAQVEEQTRLLDIRLVRSRISGASRWQAEVLGDAIPGARIWNGIIGAERGFKGLARSAGFLYAGLSDLGFRGDVRVHGTLLFLYDRGRGEIARIPTAPFGIYSIGGLEALSDSVTLVVDRSRQALSILRWNPKRAGELVACHRFFLDLPAPGGFRYGVPTVEGVTVDEAGGIWCVVDPWRGHYRAVDPVAPETLHVYLAAEMPILYRFTGDTVWAQAGLAHLWARPAAEARGRGR